MKLAMTDNGTIDLGLSWEDTLPSAVIISLLTDRRADPDDVLPFDDQSGLIAGDRRGWCGDALSDDRIGSRLWLLAREKHGADQATSPKSEETRRRAIDYAREALQWLVSDGEVAAIDVDAIWQKEGRLDMRIAITLLDGKIFNHTMNGVINAV